MSEETQNLILENIQKQVTEINISFKEFRSEISSRVQYINDEVVKLNTLDDVRSNDIKGMKRDMNGIQDKADKKHEDLEETINNIDKKVIKYIGIAVGMGIIASVGIQFLVRLIK